MNNIHDKVFTCPKCTNKTLYPVNGNENIIGMGYHELCICEECAAEFINNFLGKTFYEKGTTLTYFINEYDTTNDRLYATDNLGNGCIIWLDQIGTILFELDDKS